MRHQILWILGLVIVISAVLGGWFFDNSMGTVEFISTYWRHLALLGAFVVACCKCISMMREDYRRNSAMTDAEWREEEDRRAW